jgi:uncharacterized protein (DUF58 family)
MLAAVSQRIGSWAAVWAERRQGRDPASVTLKRRRIYILPTRFGCIFGALVFAMLLGSLNYGASLGFALTFLLTGLGLVIMHHCHNNLLGVEIRFAGAAPVFAGQAAAYRIALVNRATVARFELAVRRDRSTVGPVDVPPGHAQTFEILAATSARGWHPLGRFAVESRHPGGLFRAWTWVHMDARCLVYPTPAPAGRPIPLAAGGHGRRGMPDQDDSDFLGLRTAVPGDPPSLMAWKAYARSGELLLKQFSGAGEAPTLLDWDAMPDLDTEARLAQLARWCLDAATARRSFGLRLPGMTIPLGSGEKHLHECLQALALHGAGRA